MSHFYVSVKNRKGEYEHHEVSFEVYVYIKQLENKINNPETSKLIENAYPERFRVCSLVAKQ